MKVVLFPLALQALALFVAFGPPAFAQTHPCDASPAAVTVSGSGPLSVLFCAKPSDDIVRADVIVNGNISSFTDAEAIGQTPPSATGYVQFAVPLGILPSGQHSVSVQVVNLDDDGKEQVSDLSDAVVVTVRAPKPKPSKPKVTGVTR